MIGRVEKWSLLHQAGHASALCDVIVRNEPVPVKLLAKLTVDPPEPVPSTLTPRELQVLQRMAYGQNGPQIAREMFLSPYTVQRHRENLYRKLEVRSATQAVAKALRAGWINFPPQ